MPTPKLNDAKLQIAWATRRLNELRQSLSEFTASKPYEIFNEDEPGTGRIAVKVRATRSVPDDVRMLIGETIHSLRVPLDYLVCELAVINGNNKKNVAFPFGKDVNSFNDEASRKLSKIAASGRAFVEALEPYAGGKGHGLWVLHRLDIGHKHLDVVTVGTQSSIQSIGFGHVMGGDVHIKELRCGLQSIQEPLELMTVSKGAIVNSRVGIETSVAFGNSEVAQGLPVLDTLSNLTTQVQQVIAKAEEQFF